MKLIKINKYNLMAILAISVFVFSFLFSVRPAYAADSESAGFKFGGGRYTTGDTRRYASPSSSSKPVEQEYIQSFDMGFSCDDDVLVVPVVLDFDSDWDGYHRSGCGVIFLSKNRLSGRSYELDYHSKIERLYLAEDDKDRHYESSYIQTRDFTSFNPITIDGVYIDYYVFTESGLYKDGVSNFSFGVPYLILNDLRINGVNSSDNFQRLAQAFNNGTLSELPELAHPDPGNDFQNAEKVKNADLGYISQYREEYLIIAPDGLPSNTYHDLIDPCLNRNYWNSEKSTSGLIFTDNIYVQIQMNFRFEYAKYFIFGMTEYSSGWRDFKMVLASSGKIEFTNQDLLSFFPDEAEALRDKGGSNWGADYRYRICKKNNDNWEFGNWFNSSRDSVGDNHVISSTDENGNLTNDNPEYVNGTNTDLNVGQGETLEDANNNSKPSGGSGGGLFGSGLDAETFINQIGQIPSIIASVFSFLPAWCLAFIAAGFALFVTLMLIKLI